MNHAIRKKVRSRTRRSLKALILYDNTTCALKARASFQNALTRAGTDALWDVNFWGINFLRSTSVAEQALQDAEDAVLLLYTVGQGHGLPSWIAEWLERWAKHRRVADAAIALITDETQSWEGMRSATELFQFAMRHQLSFITRDDVEAKTEIRLLDDSAAQPGIIAPAESSRLPAIEFGDSGLASVLTQVRAA